MVHFISIVIRNISCLQQDSHQVYYHEDMTCENIIIHSPSTLNNYKAVFSEWKTSTFTFATFIHQREQLLAVTCSLPPFFMTIHISLYVQCLSKPKSFIQGSVKPNHVQNSSPSKKKNMNQMGLTLTPVSYQSLHWLSSTCLILKRCVYILVFDIEGNGSVPHTLAHTSNRFIKREQGVMEPAWGWGSNRWLFP